MIDLDFNQAKKHFNKGENVILIAGIIFSQVINKDKYETFEEAIKVFYYYYVMPGWKIDFYKIDE